MSIEHLPRWVFASVSKHFDDALHTSQYRLIIEGQHRDHETTKNYGVLTDKLELRIDGPYCGWESRNDLYVYVEVNILVQTVKNETNYHQLHMHTGRALAAFTDIPVFKFGASNEPDNTGEQITCLTKINNIGARDFIRINNFGQIEPKTELLQSSVEGHYEATIDTRRL